MPLALRVAQSLSEAAGILAADPGTRLLSGGTLVMRDVNEGRLTEGTLLRITDPAFRQMQVSGNRVEFGAGVTMAMVLANRELGFLHAPARAVGGPGIRNMATIGGNLFAETPYGDFTVALLALDAQVMVLAGYGSPRAMPLEEWLAGRSRGEARLVAGVQFNRPQNPADFRFVKVSRVKPKGLSVLSIAAHLPGSASRIGQARVTYGAMAPMPMRARGVERALEGKVLDATGIAAARAAALEGAAPATDAIATGWYRREVLPVHLARLLGERG
ncbi:MAG: FAD binding domain-containing protein [Methylobacterium sp.]|jgi:CO/xanthine dehydrogenase FAD-binding subunit|uniref:FAD binding domain-containing protein n=1 Tax=Rhabdaerophilum sp. TaxID=2717341 RepID=UPI0022BEFE58|nr:FAD binding domain-containing protein [Methylobacterium sp.]MCE2933083.1 FAD binding domain-containing protein [Hyphomicrobiales bacterium]MCZ8270865.1 FAD binding domain-containing protein [Beijerinckiaceae bacterium]MCA3635329.1 FAD binding domain-containing protein [Methylobacterium sp.]MCA3637893.1 FAD binding domain-containing protein [Methylobacterium sp.]